METGEAVLRAWCEAVGREFSPDMTFTEEDAYEAGLFAEAIKEGLELGGLDAFMAKHGSVDAWRARRYADRLTEEICEDIHAAARDYMGVS